MKGLKWLVVPGGPGMSNSYLRYALPQAFQGYNLHFYHAYGSPESLRQDVTIQEMVDQIELESKAESGENFGLITHSFGNYLAMRLLEKRNSRLKVIIMLNQIPFKFDEWQESLNTIVKKVPQDILSKLRELSHLSDDGITAFRLKYPYYIGKKSPILPIDVPLNMAACHSIAAKVSDFNDHSLVTKANIPLFRIVGELDPFYRDKNTLERDTFVLKDVGHYPFFEDIEQFKAAILKIEEILCQMTAQQIIKCS